jgi:glycosyltransferase involved in cell wall biosynthesis
LSQPFTVHQFHPHTAPGDAITQQMLFLRHALRDGGIDGEIFSLSNRAPEAFQIRKFNPARLWDCDLLLIHHSQGNPQLDTLLNMPIAKVLVYHNITPAHFFRHDAEMFRLAVEGREQLASFRGAAETAFADSQFNSEELRAIGFSDVRLLPLMDLNRAPVSMEKPARNPKDPKTLLFVGRVCPHKNQAQLLEMLFYLNRYSTLKYRLLLVGKQDMLYRRYLDQLVRLWKLEDWVEFRSGLNSVQLESTYRASDAFVCLSQHEGFCVPLLEAMRFGLPVFASLRTAVGETLGNSGAQLLSHRTDEIAEAVDTVMQDPQGLASILLSQEQRLNELSQVQCPEFARNQVGNLLQAVRFPKQNLIASQSTIELEPPP